jgi:hypothetical protein
VILAANLGFPRIGRHRELKAALECYWRATSSAEALHATAASLRARHWFAPHKPGLHHIPCDDFSLYYQTLDMIALVGAEAALREGLPTRKSDWAAYLDWVVSAFRLTTGGVAPAIQIHIHMCYSEFNDIIGAVAAMNADVISIETSRSAMELPKAFADFSYPNDIGPAVYDIHSPLVPSQEEMEALLEKALRVLTAQQLWVNPIAV